MKQCFGHDQLYVGVSIRTRFYVPENEDNIFMTKNIVFPELLE